MSQRMRATFLPDWRKGNPYQSLLAQALERQGVEVHWQQFKPGAFALNRLSGEAAGADVLHLHWINALIGQVLWRRHAALRAVELLMLALDVLIVRARGKRVVWTVHNLVAHESRNPEAEVQARHVLARVCSAVVVHSASALRRIEVAYGIRLAHKAHVIPHGNYEGCYPPDPARSAALRHELGLDDRHTVLLYFGAIRKYKGVTGLIDAFRAARNPDLRLVIAGSPRPASLKQEIEAAAASDPRVVLRIGFIPDADVAPLYALADAAIIPAERALTSGSTVLAMTMGKAMLLADEARSFDIVDERSGYFFDDMAKLTEQLDALDRSTLRRMGAEAARAAHELRWDDIASSLMRCYGDGPRRPLPLG